MKKFILKIKLKYERSLIKKYMKVREELKHNNKIIQGLKEENHKLIDAITLKNIEIRNLELGIRNERKYK